MTPRISVLLPVYNGELFLEAAIASVLGQTFPDFELLVLDDGSRDRSRSIADRLAESDPRIRVFSWDNRGISTTLNAGLERAQGCLIARMDADDISLPQRFERQVRTLDAHPEMVALGTHALMIDPEGAPICPWFALLVEHEDIERRLLSGAGGGTLIHPSVMMRRDDLSAIGGYRKEYEMAEDLDLLLRLSERGRLGNLPEILLLYRQHVSSVSVARRVQQHDAAGRALVAAWERRHLPGKPPPAVSSTPASDEGYTRAWAWQALGAGNVRTARKYARRAVRSSPLSLDAWRVLACSLRGW